MNHNFTNPVNLGNPEERTISEFAEIIKELSGKARSMGEQLLVSAK